MDAINKIVALLQENKKEMAKMEENAKEGGLKNKLIFALANQLDSNLRMEAAYDSLPREEGSRRFSIREFAYQRLQHAEKALEDSQITELLGKIAEISPAEAALSSALINKELKLENSRNYCTGNPEEAEPYHC